MSPRAQVSGRLWPATTGHDWFDRNLWMDWEPPRNYIVGEASYMSALTAIAGPVCDQGYLLPVAVSLVRDFNNPHDSNAFRAEIGRRLIGYLRRHMAARIAPPIDKMRCRSFDVPGIIRGGAPTAPNLGCHVWLEQRLGPGPRISLGPDREWAVPWPPLR